MVSETVSIRKALIFVNNSKPNVSLRKKINSRTAMYFKSFIQRIRMHFPTKVISKLKVFSCQILRNTVGKDTKAFHSFINDNAHWSVNNLKKKSEDYWVTLPIYPSITIEQVSAWWIITLPWCLSQERVSP